MTTYERGTFLPQVRTSHIPQLVYALLFCLLGVSESSAQYIYNSTNSHDTIHAHEQYTKSQNNDSHIKISQQLFNTLKNQSDSLTHENPQLLLEDKNNIVTGYTNIGSYATNEMSIIVNGLYEYLQPWFHKKGLKVKSTYHEHPVGSVDKNTQVQSGFQAANLPSVVDLHTQEAQTGKMLSIGYQNIFDSTKFDIHFYINNTNGHPAHHLATGLPLNSGFSKLKSIYTQDTSTNWNTEISDFLISTGVLKKEQRNGQTIDIYTIDHTKTIVCNTSNFLYFYAHGGFIMKGNRPPPNRELVTFMINLSKQKQTK